MSRCAIAQRRYPGRDEIKIQRGAMAKQERHSRLAVKDKRQCRRRPQLWPEFPLGEWKNIEPRLKPRPHKTTCAAAFPGLAPLRAGGRARIPTTAR